MILKIDGHEIDIVDHDLYLIAKLIELIINCHKEETNETERA